MVMKTKPALAVSLLIGVVAGILLLANTAYAEEETALEVNVDESQLYVVVIGLLGGTTIAYMKWRGTVKKYKNGLKQDTVRDKLQFSPSLFLNNVIFATLTSIPIAIATSFEQTELTLFTAFLIYTACIGTGQLISSGRK